MNEQQLKELLQKHCKLIETTYKVMGSFNAQIVVHGQKSRLVTQNLSDRIGSPAPSGQGGKSNGFFRSRHPK